MMSDVLVTGKPLYIHSPSGTTKLEHDRVIEHLYIEGLARPFTGQELIKWNYSPIDVADEIALEIEKRFSCSALLRASR